MQQHDSGIRLLEDVIGAAAELCSRMLQSVEINSTVFRNGMDTTRLDSIQCLVPLHNLNPIYLT